MATPLDDHPPIDYQNLKQTLLASQSDAELFQKIVNQPLHEYKVQTALLFVGIIGLRLCNTETGLLEQTAASNTELADNIAAVTPKPLDKSTFSPTEDNQNLLVKAIKTGRPQHTTDWQFLLTPYLTPEQAALDQASAGIAYSAVYPLKARAGGVLTFHYFQYPQAIGEAQEAFMKNYTDLVNGVLGD